MRARTSLNQCFNSTLVRLGRHELLSGNEPDLCFNSTLVRLGPFTDWIKRMEQEAFQFHSGSIRAGRRCRIEQPINCFNSTLVRLGPEDRHESGGHKEIVSIPLWFD